ncbi:hypothetical protein ACFPER_09895 [Agromyces aurantiacus]|uniref:NYN domain-containing protein n=1 Tax=Agromyces aurantiacus TaxID=165814 RepID=A0ABV9R6L7_9MICO|nr:hypothetical protein [Agromyces aurantiacus]MBM7503786.1 hypothetical protein [Agromyces aurantiacus]
MTDDAEPAKPVTVVVDVANVMGSRPDGWWRDREGAATRLLAGMSALVGRDVDDPDGQPMRIARIVAVLEGQARTASDPGGLEIVRALGEGDDAIADAARVLVGAGTAVVVVTGDRGLRARLPADARAAGQGWLNALLGR